MYVINQQTLLAVTMCKTVVLLLAVLANICLLVSSTESKSYSRTASSSSSSSSQSNSSSSYSSSECTEDDEDYEPTCCEDEVYSDCINGGCQAKNCSQIGKPIPCVKIDPKYCIEGCLCKDGYLRTVGGTCVPKDKCDEGCGGDPNAVSGCGVNCGRLCSNYKKKGVACPAICKLDGCDCKPDYVFDSITQKCVFPKDCTPTCGTNEVYSNCSNQICSFQNCSEVGGIIRFCPKIDETRCKGGCICQEGYLRNTKGVCVLRKECDICNHDINSVPGCGINCGRLCSNYDKGPVPCPKICKTNACNCKPDFVMDTNTGKCVLPKDCTPTCGTDEIYSSCVNGLCRAVNCSQKGKPIACPLLIKGACRGGCICKDKYLREKNGTCVPQDQCGVVPPQCGKNEVFNECPIICPPKRCDVDITVILCQVPPKPGDPDCKPSCECIDGYLRDKNGLCIPKDKCPQTCDGPNEEWDSCPPNCPPQTCASIGKIYHCPLQTIPPTNCKGSCRCKEGFYRNDFGECISYEACTQNCTGKNEEWDTCPPICPPQTCESIGKSYSCPAMINGKNCQPSCRCKPGFYRNKRNECISEDDCLKCTGPHEYFSCGGACDNVCATLDTENKTHCSIVNIKCNEMCYCEDGYARNDTGTCIPIKDCKKCPEGEIYNTCPPVKCDAEYCPQSRDDPLSCPIGIVCDKPRCTCGFNSHRDRRTNKCIATRDCPTFKCDGQNEEYNSCPPVCPGQTCNDYINNATCPKYRIGIVVPCTPKCRCTKGNWRNVEGVCVSGRECAKCPNPNEVWDECPAPCPPRRCDVDERVIRCAAPPKPGSPNCKPSCRCANGFYRNEKGICVTRDQCKKETNTTNETLPKTNTTSPPVNSTDAQQRFENGNVIFTGKCFKEIVETNNGSSVIMSPFSILFLLAQLALYTKEDSHKELMNILSLNSDDEIRDVFPKIIKMYQEQQSVQFDLAGKVYINDKYELSDAFKQDTKNVFDSEADNIDVSNPQKAAATINAWVEAKTNHLITDLVSPQMINDLTRLVLTNAIYFKGNWVKQFNPKYTTERNFTLANHDVKQIKMMYQKGSFRYAESKELDAKILELPYKGKNFTFVAILPNKVDGVNALVKKLVDPDVFKRAMSSLTTSTVMIHLPIVETSLQIDLTTILKKLGVTKCFIPGESGITGILKKLVDLYVSVFLQKAKIIINETGTEAAAANVAIVGTTAAIFPPPVVNTFDADHAFAYFLNLEDKPMFIGTYTGKP